MKLLKQPTCSKTFKNQPRRHIIKDNVKKKNEKGVFFILVMNIVLQIVPTRPAGTKKKK